MRYVYLIFIFLVVATVSILGFRGGTSTQPPLEVFPDMDRQPKYQPQAASEFFADGRVDRHPPANAVARGAFFENPYAADGREGEAFGSGFPIEVTLEAMNRGQERYQIYCAVCHGATGDGQGRTAQYGMTAIANLVAAPYIEMPEGELFHYISNGSRSGRMLPYKDNVSVEDRWKIVLYLRALQRAANGTADDLTSAEREDLGL